MKNESEEEANKRVEKEEKRKWGDKCKRSGVYIGKKWGGWREIQI